MAAESLPLRDIHLPEPVSWWPPAPGWWLLLIAGIIIIAGLLVFRRISNSRLLKRTVIAELNTVREAYHQNHDPVELVKSLSTLMRRASISFYPRGTAASLTGQDWLKYLDSTSTRKDFEHGNGRILATAPYLPANSRIDVDLEDLLSLCENWLNNQPFKGDAK
ncbi:MAG: DUF4381 domain-containing protein [Gammaproteobacteria bacterium]|nr:DUF4381 domain-containing protein [Gammaproteobacteria bacterium]NNL06223.1 DUF4381 domain-containing protein [Gammaproteobacteria bacterium]